MKNTAIVLLIPFSILLVGFTIWNHMETSDRDRLKQVEIDGLNKRIKEQADSLKLLKPCQ